MNFGEKYLEVAELANKGLLFFSIVTPIFFLMILGLNRLLLAIGVILIFYFLCKLSGSIKNNFIVKLCVYALIVRVTTTIILTVGFQSIHGHPFMLGALGDEDTYHIWGKALADSWHGRGNFKVHVPYSWNYSGFFYVIGAVYYIFGPSVIIFNILYTILNVITVYLIYDIVRRIFNEDAARWSSIFLAFFPYLVIFSGLHYKDAILVILELLGIWSFIRWQNTPKNILYLILAFCSGLAMFSFRFEYCVLFIMSIAIASALSLTGVKSTRTLAVIFATIVIFLYSYQSFFQNLAIEEEIPGSWSGEHAFVLRTQSLSIKNKSMIHQLYKGIGTLAIPILPMPTVVHAGTKHEFSNDLFLAASAIMLYMSLYVLAGSLSFLREAKTNSLTSLFLIFLLIFIVWNGLVVKAFALTYRHKLILYPLFLIFAGNGYLHVRRKMHLNVLWLLLILSMTIIYNLLRLEAHGL